MALLVAPLLGVVMTIAAQVAVVVRDDLQSLTVKRYGQRVAAVLLVSVVVVNLVTIAVDLQAGAAGIGLLAGVNSRWLVAPSRLPAATTAAGPIRAAGARADTVGAGQPHRLAA